MGRGILRACISCHCPMDRNGRKSKGLHSGGEGMDIRRTGGTPLLPTILDDGLHHGGVASRRLSEKAPVFSAELRGAFVADKERYRCCVGLSGNHALARTLQADMFLILQRAEGRDLLAAPVKHGRAHTRNRSHVVNAELLGVVFPDPRHGSTDMGQTGVDARDLTQHLGMRAEHQAEHQLMLKVQRHNRNLSGSLAHFQQPLPGSDQFRIGNAEGETRLHLQLRRLGQIEHHVHDDGGVKIKADRQEWFLG